MSDSWDRRSATTSSGSSSIGGGGFFYGNGLFETTSSFESELSFLMGNDNNDFMAAQSFKPAVKLLPLAPRLSTRESAKILSDSDSFFFNSSPNPESMSSIGETFSFMGSTRNAQLLPVSAAAADVYVPPRLDITLQDVVLNGQLVDFALDRYGVKFLETNFPQDHKDVVHATVFQKFTESTSLFAMLCHDPNGNFIIQKLVEFASVVEQRVLLARMVEGGLFEMCKDKFACRVVQLSIQKFDSCVVTQLVNTLSMYDFVAICTDQSAIHVVQRIVKNLPVQIWSFFITFLCSGDNLMLVCQDKYGCRLVQQALDRLAENPKLPCFTSRLPLLHSLMTCVARNCYRLSSNEFANYVVQYVIKSSGIMEMYRDTIIDKCLLRNLLSMSQDKYASHVIEGAFIFAPSKLLTEMMNEIFDGYVKDCDSNRDALDILLFHQYGNYVVQQMITICTSALMGKEERRLTPSELGMYAAWYEKIKVRVQLHSSRLERFSSGKKIIDSVMKLPSLGLPILPKRAPSVQELSAQFNVMFPSFLNNF